MCVSGHSGSCLMLAQQGSLANTANQGCQFFIRVELNGAAPSLLGLEPGHTLTPGTSGAFGVRGPAALRPLRAFGDPVTALTCPCALSLLYRSVHFIEALTVTVAYSGSVRRAGVLCRVPERQAVVMQLSGSDPNSLARIHTVVWPIVARCRSSPLDLLTSP